MKFYEYIAETDRGREKSKPDSAIETYSINEKEFIWHPVICMNTKEPETEKQINAAEKRKVRLSS